MSEEVDRNDPELKYLSVERNQFNDPATQAEWTQKRLVWVPHENQVRDPAAPSIFGFFVNQHWHAQIVSTRHSTYLPQSIFSFVYVLVFAVACSLRSLYMLILWQRQRQRWRRRLRRLSPDCVAAT